MWWPCNGHTYWCLLWILGPKVCVYTQTQVAMIWNRCHVFPVVWRSHQCARYLHVDCHWYAVAEWSNIWSKYTCHSAITVITNRQQSPRKPFVIEKDLSLLFHVVFTQLCSLHRSYLETSNKLFLHLEDKYVDLPSPVFSPSCILPSPVFYSSNFSNPFPNNAQSNGLEHIYLGWEECSINILLMKSWEQRSALDACPNRTRKRVRGTERGRVTRRDGKENRTRGKREGGAGDRDVCFLDTHGNFFWRERHRSFKT